MLRRLLPGLLAILAAYADARGAHALAFDLLLGAIPLAAVAALETFGAYLDDRSDAVAGLQALLWTLALTLLVVSCAARSSAADTRTLPALGWSALVASLAVFAIKTCVAAGPYARRLALVKPAKP